jgi:hypothetical protein
MGYGLKYFGEFSDIENNDYKIEILELNYTGFSARFTCAASPVIHTWDKDEPLAAIKGSQVQINLVNTGNLPLSNFYSDSDDTFQIKVFLNNILVFYGYLVQDDCMEEITDIEHVITLTATDNIGLLKNVTIDEAIGSTTFKYISILEFFFYCINQTKISLPTVLFCNLTETTFNTTNTFLSQTYLNFQSFSNSSNEQTYDNCYSVLEKIFSRFNISLFQANGQWNIIRWNEARYYNGAIPYRFYDETQVQVSTGFYSNQLYVGHGTNMPIEYGALQRINRNIKFSLDTFNYTRPAQLFNNIDLKRLGNLLKSYTIGTGVNLQYYDEYDLVGWGAGFVWDNSGTQLFDTRSYKAIRVVRDYRLKEIDRYLIASGNGYNDFFRTNAAISSAPMEVNVGDILKINFQVRRKDSYDAGIGNDYMLQFGGWLNTKMPISPRGVNNRFLDIAGKWRTYISGSISGNNFGPIITGGQDIAEWTTVEIETFEIPYDGNFYLQLGNYVRPQFNEWRFKNFKVEVFNNADKFGLVKGQTHKQSQNVGVKNTQQNIINVDDSISNTIGGTLFGVNTIGGLVRQRTSNWRRLHTTENRGLGDIITFEKLFNKRYARTGVECRIIGVKSGNVIISSLSLFQLTNFIGVNFVAGRMEIDYANTSCKVNLFELHKDGETDAMLTSNYQFNYILDTK